jgi:hypothetical protein
LTLHRPITVTHTTVNNFVFIKTTFRLYNAIQYYASLLCKCSTMFLSLSYNATIHSKTCGRYGVSPLNHLPTPRMRQFQPLPAFSSFRERVLKGSVLVLLC